MLNNLYIEGINRNNMSQEKLQIIQTFLSAKYKFTIRGLIRKGNEENVICVYSRLSENCYDLEEISKEINNILSPKVMK